MSALLTFRQAMRRLWSDHVIWMHIYLISTVAAAPDYEAAAGRLLRNQEDIGDAIAPYYGKNVGDKLAELLKRHILITVDLIGAAKSNDQRKFMEYDRKCTKNADDIASFLSEANPNWSKKETTDLLYLHLNLTKEEVRARLNRNWSDDVKKFDEIFTEAMLIADILSEGVIKQFPNKF